MESRTATQVAQEERLINLRKRRAMQLLSELMHELSANNVQCDMKALHDVMLEVFYRNGAYIMTDEGRASEGLPPRDDHGWTETDRLRRSREKHQAALSLMNFITATHS